MSPLFPPVIVPLYVPTSPLMVPPEFVTAPEPVKLSKDESMPRLTV